MASQTNPTIDVPALLNRLKKRYDEISVDVSSTKDIKKMLDRLMNQFPLSPQWEQNVSHRFLQLDTLCQMEPIDFRSIRKELALINEYLRQLASEADQDVFQALSEIEQNIIIGEAGEDARLKCLRESYEIFLRLDEVKHDPRICLFLAIFPQHAVLRKRFLIYWWIGEGFVEDEEDGERVFEKLLDLEILTPHRTDKCPIVSKCQIFPWMRYMLISEAMKEMLLKLDGGIPRFDSTHSRHACLIADHSSESDGSKLEKCWTIFNVNQRDIYFPHQWLAKLNRLGVLQLGRWQVSPAHHIEVTDESFLTDLKSQKYLKFLSLRGISRITSLPDSIRELVSLLILDLKACHNLETLPAAIASLKKLTHLDVSECYLLESMPKGLDKLTSLQVLKGFIIGNSLKTVIKLSHLSSLNNLRRLSVHIGSESEAAILKEGFDKLKDLEKVKCLKISWGKAIIVESLSFPKGLKKLDLEGIPNETKPDWWEPIQLRDLETLYIKGGKLGNLMDASERWISVKYLVLKYTNMPPINEETLKSVFPSLTYVKKVEWVKKGEQDVVQYEWNKG